MSSASTSRRSRSSRCSRYSRSFACGSHTTGPCPGQSASSSQRLQTTQRVEVGGQRAAAGRDEDAALAEHRVAAEQRRLPASSETWSAEWPGVAITWNGPEPVAVLQHDVRLEAGQRRLLEPSAARAAVRAATGAPERSAQLRHRLRVIEVVVRQRRCPRSRPAPAPPATRRSTCAGSAGPGSITHAGVADQPRVRARERHRPGVGRAHQRDALRHALCDVAAPSAAREQYP